MRHYNTIQEIKTGVLGLLQERLAHIDFCQENYAVEDEVDRIVVSYNGIRVLTATPFISNVVEDGLHRICGMFSMRAMWDDYWYDNDDLDTDIFVDEFMRCQFQNRPTTFKELLDVLLPLADKGKVKKIGAELEKIGFENATVRFDTYGYKYVAEGDIHSFLFEREVEGDDDAGVKKRFFKYMSFNTYIEMLKSKKMRLNSIMSMNDSSEMFYLGDYLCKAYEDERRKVLHPKSQYFLDGGLHKKKVVEYKNNLIGCFSEKKDDALMWRLYGDGGKGVCLEFQIDNDTLKPVLYLGEKNQKVGQLIDVATRLKNDGISLYYKDMSNYHYYTKSWYYRDECEWRIVQKAGDEELQVANYDGLMCLYKDYPFEELGLKPSMLYVGANMAYKDVNVPLLTDLSRRKLGVEHVMMSNVESLRV